LKECCVLDLLGAFSDNSTSDHAVHTALADATHNTVIPRLTPLRAPGVLDGPVGLALLLAEGNESDTVVKHLGVAADRV